MARAEKVSYWRGKSSTIPANGISGRIMMEEDTGNCYLEFNDFNAETGAWEVTRRRLTDTRKFDIDGGLYTGPVVLAMQPDQAQQIIENTTDVTSKYYGLPISQIAATKQYVDNVTGSLHTHINNTDVHLRMHNEITEREYWNNKVDSEPGKGLSTNDFTDSYKTKLDGIAENATKVEYEASQIEGIEIGTIIINNQEFIIYVPEVIDIPGNAETATKLKSAKLIDGVPFDGSENINHFGTSYTLGDNPNKEVTVSNFDLQVGSSAYIKFTYADDGIVDIVPRTIEQRLSEEYPDVIDISSYFNIQYQSYFEFWDTNYETAMVAVPNSEESELYDLPFSGQRYALKIKRSIDSNIFEYLIFELPEGTYAPLDPEDPDGDTVFIEYSWLGLIKLAYGYSENPITAFIEFSDDELSISGQSSEILNFTLLEKDQSNGFYGQGLLDANHHFDEYEDELPQTISVVGQDTIHFEIQEEREAPTLWVKTSVQSDTLIWMTIDDFLSEYSEGSYDPSSLPYISDTITYNKQVVLPGVNYTLFSNTFDINWKISDFNPSEFITLKINDFDRYPIIYQGSQLGRGKIDNGTYHIVYDSSKYQLIGELDTDTTYDIATETQSGLMSPQDKLDIHQLQLDIVPIQEKLNGIEEHANNYILPPASEDTLGGIRIGDNITYIDSTISITDEDVIDALGYTPYDGSIDIDDIIDQIGVFEGVNKNDPTSEGSIGLVPEPTYLSADYDKFLRGDGTWSRIPESKTISKQEICEILGIPYEPTDIEKLLMSIDITNLFTLSREDHMLINVEQFLYYSNTVSSYVLQPNTYYSMMITFTTLHELDSPNGDIFYLIINLGDNSLTFTNSASNNSLEDNYIHLIYTHTLSDVKLGGLKLYGSGDQIPSDGSWLECILIPEEDIKDI